MSDLQNRIQQAEFDEVIESLIETIKEQEDALADEWELYQRQSAVWLATSDGTELVVGTYEQIDTLRFLKQCRELLPVFRKLLDCIRDIDEPPEKLKDLIKVCYDELNTPIRPESDDAVPVDSVVQHIKNGKSNEVPDEVESGSSDEGDHEKSEENSPDDESD